MALSVAATADGSSPSSLTQLETLLRFAGNLRLLPAGPSEYLYLQSGPAAVDGVDDAEEFGNTCEKLSTLGFSEEQQAELCRVCSAVLLLGNVAFAGEGGTEPKEGQKLAVVHDAPLDDASSLLQVEPTALRSSLLSRKVSSGRGSSYTVPLSEQQCLDTRDALAKAIYASLFEWIVAHLNAYMAPPDAGSAADKETNLFVGLLDVFGFENFEFNSFEQVCAASRRSRLPVVASAPSVCVPLFSAHPTFASATVVGQLCINFTNERLQQQFIDALVKLQQQDYEREGLQQIEITYPDNAEQLSLLDAKMGVMGLLDEECALPKGSEESYVEKMHARFASSPHYEKPARGKIKAKRRSVVPSASGAMGSASTATAGKDLDVLQFSIAHYAGNVTYTAESWIDKNRGYLAPDLAFLMSTSSSTLLSTLFPRGSGGESKKSSTVLASFRASLRALSSTLLETNARYIRCLKPNASKTAGYFDGHFIARQLRYTGVSAVVEIQRSGYPISLPKADFIKRYRSCAFSDAALTSADLPVDTLCANVLSSIESLLCLETSWLDTLVVQLGKSKIFLREEAVVPSTARSKRAACIDARLLSRRVPCPFPARPLRHVCQRCTRTQVRLIEKAREAIWEEAATAGQRVARGMIARKGSQLMQAHSKAACNVRLALDAKEVVVANAALAVLQKAWDESRVSKRACVSLAWKQRELAELTAEVGQMMEALALETEAHASLAQVIESVEGGAGDFVALKVAWQSAGEAAPLALSVELASAMHKAKALLDAEEARVREAKVEAERAAEAAEKAAAKAEAERAAADAAADAAAQEAARLADEAARAKVKRQAEEYEAAEAKRRRDEEEVARQATERARAAEAAAEADALAAEGMDVIEVEVRNDPRPEKGAAG